MGLIGYFLMVLGIACLACKAEWLIPIRGYLIFLFIGVGCAFLSIELLDEDPTLIIFPGFFVVLCFSLLLWAIINRKKQKDEILHIPAGSYQTQVVDRIGAPTIQLSYLLFYQGKTYHLSSTPPNGTPALILHAKTRKNSDVILADIAIDRSNEPVSIQQRIQQLRTFSTFLAAFLIPITYMMYQNHSISENLMPYCMMIVLGQSSIAISRGSKVLLHRLIYCSGVFFEGFGRIVGTIIAIIAFLN